MKTISRQVWVRKPLEHFWKKLIWISFAAELKEELFTAAGQKRVRILKRLEVVEVFPCFRKPTGTVILDAIPVIPPDICPNGTVRRW